MNFIQVRAHVGGGIGLQFKSGRSFFDQVGFFDIESEVIFAPGFQEVYKKVISEQIVEFFHF